MSALWFTVADLRGGRVDGGFFGTDDVLAGNPEDAAREAVITWLREEERGREVGRDVGKVFVEVTHPSRAAVRFEVFAELAWTAQAKAAP